MAIVITNPILTDAVFDFNLKDATFKKISSVSITEQLQADTKAPNRYIIEIEAWELPEVKASGPQIVPMQEIIAYKNDSLAKRPVLYIQQKDNPEIKPVLAFCFEDIWDIQDRVTEIILQVFGSDMDYTFQVNQYLTEWRLWTAEPSEKLMEEIPWKE